MTAAKLSPLAPASFPDLPEIAGVRFASAATGLKYKGRDDVMLAVLSPGTTIAGVFTRSATCSAAVLDCREKIGGIPDGAAAILVNAGNANAFTGHYGQTSVTRICEALGERLGIDPGRVFTASTGVIGEPLEHDRIIGTLDMLEAGLDGAHAGAAAKAIMTTDTFPKGAFARVEIAGKQVNIAGFAKGSGMIAPDMATMLAYVFTDASIAQPVLQEMLAKEANSSFNCITVDSDTSTSDTLLLCATGQAQNREISTSSSDEAKAFSASLHGVLLDLAQQIVRDGEGASKFVEVRVKAAATDTDARKVAMAIANSPLVKTAIAGEDPNWGRIVMAIGKSGAKADRDRLSIRFGDILVAEKGWVSPNYREEEAAHYMKQPELVIAVDLGLGEGEATVWTCDLTHGYIEINADYRS